MAGSELVVEFVKLHFQYGTARAFRREGFYDNNVQLFHWAQVLGAQHAPRVQNELNSIRRQVMEVLTRQMHERIRHGDPIIAPAQKEQRARWTWMDYQITPEVSHDAALTGLVCDFQLVVHLKHALRNQIEAIKLITGI